MSGFEKIQIGEESFVDPPKFHLGQKITLDYLGEIDDFWIIGHFYNVNADYWVYIINNALDQDEVTATQIEYMMDDGQ